MISRSLWRKVYISVFAATFSLLTITYTAYAAGWASQTSGTSANLNAVSFTDVQAGLAVGTGGVIRKTLNGGASWTTSSSGTSTTLNDIFVVPTTSVAYVVGNSGTIRKTINLGTSWSAQTSGTGAHLLAIHFSSGTDQNGLAVGDDGTIRKTLNGGSTWTTSTSGTTAVLNDVFIVPGTSIAYVVGSGGVIRKSINLGTSWSAQTSGTSSSFNSVHFVDSSNGWAVGNSGVIRHTTNGGSTWTGQTSGTGAHLLAVYFVDSQNGWIVGDDGVGLRTTNGGSSWVSVPPETLSPLFGLHFANASSGWAVGGAGTIRYFDSTPPTLSSVSPTSATAGVSTALNVTYSDVSGVGYCSMYWSSGGLIGAMTLSSPGGTSGTATISYTFGSPGTYSIGPSCGDGAGNSNAAGTYTTITVVSSDATPPNTTITSSPAGTSSSSSASFEFTATESSTFECRLDGGSFSACTSPRTYSGLAVGAHTFEVRAIDTSGNVDTTPASYSWSITSSNNPPNSPSSLSQHDQPGDSASGVGFVDANDTQITFQGVVSDPDAGQTMRMDIEFQPIGVTFTNTAMAGSSLVTNGSIATVTYGGIGNGSYHWQARTVDASGAASAWISFGGNSESSADFSISIAGGIDTTAPTGSVVINSGAAATNSTSVTLTLSCSDNFGCTQMQVATDGTASTEAFETFTTSRTVSLPSGSGTKTVAVRFRDAAGNLSAQVSDTITLDTVTPTVGSVFPTAASTGVMQAFNATYSDSQGIIMCDLYVNGVNNGSMTFPSGITGTATRAVTFTSPGAYTLQARCSDAAGNVGFGTLTTVNVSGAVTPAPSPSPSGSPPFALEQMFSDATVVVTGDRSFLLSYSGVSMCQMDEMTATARVNTVFGAISNATVRTSIINFVSCGTPTTLHLGAGERAGIVNSYKAAFGRLPSTSAHWYDVIKIGNGRFPGETSASSEGAASVRFKRIYLRNPSVINENDKAAVTIMSYGLRPLPRNVNSERAAIITFKAVFRYNPSSATDWDAVRAIAYSGARR